MDNENEIIYLLRSIRFMVRWIIAFWIVVWLVSCVAAISGVSV